MLEQYCGFQRLYRREWNAPGATIEKPVPVDFKMSILPIEARDAIDEQEYQALAEAGLTAGQTQLRALLGVEIPKRTRDMAVANLRRLEMDRYTAWLEGLIRQRNPQNRNQVVVASFPWAGSVTHSLSQVIVWSTLQVPLMDSNRCPAGSSTATAPMPCPACGRTR